MLNGKCLLLQTVVIFFFCKEDLTLISPCNTWVTSSDWGRASVICTQIFGKIMETTAMPKLTPETQRSVQESTVSTCFRVMESQVPALPPLWDLWLCGHRGGYCLSVPWLPLIQDGRRVSTSLGCWELRVWPIVSSQYLRAITKFMTEKQRPDGGSISQLSERETQTQFSFPCLFFFIFPMFCLEYSSWLLAIWMGPLPVKSSVGGLPPAQPPCLWLCLLWPISHTTTRLLCQQRASDLVTYSQLMSNLTGLQNQLGKSPNAHVLGPHTPQTSSPAHLGWAVQLLSQVVLMHEIWAGTLTQEDQVWAP